MWLALLAGCGNPLSNAIFIEDEAFLSAWPSTERVGFSSHWAGRVVGPETEPVLRHALTEAGELDRRISLITGVADILRTTEPAERSDTHRLWDPRSLAAPSGADADTWWIRADTVRAQVGSDILWTVEGAPGPDGPWEVVGAGRHDPEGVGAFRWELGLTGALLGLSLGDVLEVDYDEGREEGVRGASLRMPAATLLPREYHLIGREIFAWTGELDLADLGPEPGFAAAILMADGSGRSEGVVFREVEVGFRTCWGTDGAPQAQEGGEGFPTLGEMSACTAPDLLAEP